MDGKPTVLTFDLFEGQSPLIIVLDGKRYAETINMSTPTPITFRKPTDTGDRLFFTYIAKYIDGNDHDKF